MIRVISSSAASMRLEISTFCSRVSSATCPIWFRYIRTGSSRMSSRDLSSSSSSASGFRTLSTSALVHDLDLERTQLGKKFRPAFPGVASLSGVGSTSLMSPWVSCPCSCASRGRVPSCGSFSGKLGGGTVGREGGGFRKLYGGSCDSALLLFRDESAPVLRNLCFRHTDS